MQVIGCQFDIAWEDKAVNFDRAAALVGDISVEPGALLVLPEMFATGFSMQLENILEPEQGPTQQFLCQLARQTGAYVIGGVATASADGRGRNEALVVDPQGNEILRYCKLHPFSLGGEDKHFVRGSETASFHWGEFHVAPFICYDLRFPEIFRQQTRLGAQVLVVIANWPATRDAHWQTLLAARAIENQAYVIGVNRVGSDPQLVYAGHSMIIDPRGELLALAGQTPLIVQAQLSLEPLIEYRQQFPALRDMRDEYFARSPSAN
jgi:predicted amidohydrolase